MWKTVNGPKAPKGVLRIPGVPALDLDPEELIRFNQGSGKAGFVTDKWKVK